MEKKLFHFSGYCQYRKKILSTSYCNCNLLYCITCFALELFMMYNAQCQTIRAHWKQFPFWKQSPLCLHCTEVFFRDTALVYLALQKFQWFVSINCTHQNLTGNKHTIWNENNDTSNNCSKVLAVFDGEVCFLKESLKHCSIYLLQAKRRWSCNLVKWSWAH